MKKRNTPKLIKLVKQEASKLKKHATQEELSRLSFSSLVAQSPSRCVYGLMTNHCESERAIELMKLCCKEVYTYDSLNGNQNTINIIPEVRKDNFWSPIEVFSYQNVNEENGNNSNLIEYLKGEVKTLKLKL